MNPEFFPHGAEGTIDNTVVDGLVLRIEGLPISFRSLVIQCSDQLDDSVLPHLQVALARAKHAIEGLVTAQLSGRYGTRDAYEDWLDVLSGNEGGWRLK